MTCIVAMKIKDGVLFGADSLGANPYSKGTYLNKKIFRKGDCTFGVCGAYRLIQLLQYKFTPPEHLKDSVEVYLNTLFIDEIRQVLGDNEFKEKTSEVTAIPDSNFLLSYRKRLFVVQEDFSILEPEVGFAAAGSGKFLAQGSMYATQQNKMAVSEQLDTALRAAEHFNPYVRRPFHFIEG